ncbi:MAG: hypothetical protein Q9177_006259 [Variospora cf. flavescens]
MPPPLPAESDAESTAADEVIDTNPEPVEAEGDVELEDAPGKAEGEEEEDEDEEDGDEEVSVTPHRPKKASNATITAMSSRRSSATTIILKM